ncbi:MAG: EamA family transporter [Patescibacteria group bacterium]|jgi:drug/metabolite transporter (DMT)-like permease
MLKNWFICGLGSAISFASMVIIYKRLFVLGIKPLVLNLFMFAFVFIGFLVWNLSTKTKPDLTIKMVLFLLLASMFSLLGNYFYVTSVGLAPNPGYAATIKASEIIFITVFSFLLFRSSLNIVAFLGVCFVFLGIYLISR